MDKKSIFVPDGYMSGINSGPCAVLVLVRVAMKLFWFGKSESFGMSQKCRLCGAEVPWGNQCRDRFDICIAAEFENPATFGAVHHLTVLCYMLQHNAYSRDAWFAAREMLSRIIREGVAPSSLGKQVRAWVDGGNRTWRITRGARFSEFDKIVWSSTIAAVRSDNPETYCSDIRLWAADILEDTKSLYKNHNKHPLKT